MGSRSTGLALTHRFFGGKFPGDPEGDFLAVHRVVFAVVDPHANVPAGEIRRWPLPPAGRGRPFRRPAGTGRDRAAEDLIDELKARVPLRRLHLQVHLAELPGPARLLLVPVVALGVLADRLAVGIFGTFVVTSSFETACPSSIA